MNFGIGLPSLVANFVTFDLIRSGLVLVELMAGVTVDQIKEKTDAKFEVSLGSAGCAIC